MDGGEIHAEAPLRARVRARHRAVRWQPPRPPRTTRPTPWTCTRPSLTPGPPPTWRNRATTSPRPRWQADGRVRVTLVLSPQERAQLRKEGVQTDAVRDARAAPRVSVPSPRRPAATTSSARTTSRAGSATSSTPSPRRTPASSSSRSSATPSRVARSSRSRSPRAPRAQQDGKRPAVLYMSNQHAREWISVEVNRRLLNWYIDQRKAENPEIVDLLKTTELWFIISANPDGYQYTFDHERLWRRNLRDNDGNGADHRRRRRRPQPQLRRALELRRRGFVRRSISSDTYRGPAPARRPRPQAAAGLIDRVKPKFARQLPLVRPAHPVSAGLAGRDAGRRQPDLHRARRHRREPRHPGLRPGHQLRRAVRDQRRDDRLRRDDRGRHRVHAGTRTRAARAAASSSPMTRRSSRPNSRRPSPSISTSPCRRRTRAIPSSHLGTTVEPFYLSQTEVDPENGTLVHVRLPVRQVLRRSRRKSASSRSGASAPSR